MRATVAVVSIAAAALTVGGFLLSASSQPAAATAAHFAGANQLGFPDGYRRWTFLTSGSDMSYAVSAAPGGHFFDNVFASPGAVDGFESTGVWPNGTVLLVAVRVGATSGSITKSGVFQTGEAVAIEAHVKDAARFPGGWGFYHFDPGQKQAALLPATASCYSCHAAHAAADTTFVQFYPTLLPIARRKGTISEAYQHDPAAQPH